MIVVIRCRFKAIVFSVGRMALRGVTGAAASYGFQMTPCPQPDRKKDKISAFARVGILLFEDFIEKIIA